MKGNDFLDYEGLTKYHDRLVESIDEKITSVKKQLEKRDDESLYTVGVIQEEMDDVHKAISGILNVFNDNITWQDE